MIGEEGRRVAMKPPNVLGAGVRPFVSMLVLGEKRDAVGREPEVMDGRLTEPFSAWMVGVELQVATNLRSLAEGKQVNLSPGMAVTVEIKTGQRRIIEYLLSPLLKSMKESLRER